MRWGFDERWSSRVPFPLVRGGIEGEVRDDVEVGPSHLVVVDLQLSASSGAFMSVLLDHHPCIRIFPSLFKLVVIRLTPPFV